MGFVLEFHPFICQEIRLFRPSGCQTAGRIYNPIAGVVAEIFRAAQYLPDQPGIFRPPDEAGNLPVGCNTALRNL